MAEGQEGVCEKHQEPLTFYCKDDEAPVCVVCRRSKEHKDHEVTPLEETYLKNEEAVSSSGKAGACEKHQKPLNLFCKVDDALMCVDCEGSQEHKYHDVIPLEEAAQGFKNDFYDFLKILKKERENLLALKSNIVKESQDLLKRTKTDKQKTVAEFRKLHQFLEIQENRLLAQVEELEKELSRKRDQHLARLSEELSSLESRIQEMEEKIQEPPSELLQGVRSALQRFEEKEKFETSAQMEKALKWQIWDFWGISHSLEGVMKPFKDTLVSGLQLQKAFVTLDPDTAHPALLPSQDRKSIGMREKSQDLPNNPERFNVESFVLGCEGFTTGRYFWEILVGREGTWDVGVARKSLRRKGRITISPQEGIWAVGNRNVSAYTDPFLYRFALKQENKRIRVVLNCDGGQVSFFDSDTAAHLYTFSGADFSGETLQPFFQDEIRSCLEILRNERENMLGYKADAEKESHHLLETIERERQKNVVWFRQVYQLLEVQEKRQLAQLENVEKEIASKSDECLAKLSEEISSLDSLIQEIEEKLQQPDTQVLQDIRSTMQRYRKKETFHNPVDFPRELKKQLWDVWDRNWFLEKIVDKFQDSLVIGLLPQKVNVTLDPASMSPHLVLSKDLKNITWQDRPEDPPGNPDRVFAYALGSEGFTAGHYFWDVSVGSEEKWAVGVARKFETGGFTFTPKEGVWAVGRSEGQYKAFIRGVYSPLLGEPKRIRVCLNYDGGDVAFYDVDRETLVYRFLGALFSGETLYPFFAVYGKGSLRISPESN